MRWVILVWTILVLGMWMTDLGNVATELRDNPFQGVAVGVNTIVYFALWAIVAGALALLWVLFRRQNRT